DGQVKVTDDAHVLVAQDDFERTITLLSSFRAMKAAREASAGSDRSTAISSKTSSSHGSHAKLCGLAISGATACCVDGSNGA
ncbi:hypothetical protein, partial [Mesorhizobium sp. M2E.F.Ca.ET.154.01.1.1]|uniref:hypothetical protein n=1 Tax=Mesorhizobium sp. M2E.F.Ca.ET.154.01.1.1 TaxID=2500521 RepID=UPI001AED366F